MVRRLGRDDLIARFRADRPMVLPSLLACDFAHLEDEIRAVEAAGAPALHLDVMDGHFVPNLSIGVPIVEAVRRVTNLPLDVHLMITNPVQYIEPFRNAGADSLTIHIEAVPEPQRLLDRIRSLGCLAGLSLNPPTPVSAIEPCLPYCDLILVMSVMPGFGGQKFDPVALAKARELAARSNRNFLLEIDGGIDPQTVMPSAAAGIEMFVAGTTIFKSPDYAATIERLRSNALSSAQTTASTN
jgi:ribulose-phosphate 3-epimerase